jgi:hypothetical protein
VDLQPDNAQSVLRRRETTAFAGKRAYAHAVRPLAQWTTSERVV